MKAISGGKKSPQDQGELDGALKELGYDKSQVYKVRFPSLPALVATLLLWRTRES